MYLGMLRIRIRKIRQPQSKESGNQRGNKQTIAGRSEDVLPPLPSPTLYSSLPCEDATGGGRGNPHPYTLIIYDTDR